MIHAITPDTARGKPAAFDEYGVIRPAMSLGAVKGVGGVHALILGRARSGLRAFF